MSGLNEKTKALHVATMSGWYRFEKDGREWRQVKRDLSYWTLTCLAVDPENPELIYAGTEHSGLFYSKDAGAHWLRANPNVPKMMLFSALALNGGVMVGTVPSAVFRSKSGGGWEELEGVRINSANANFPPSPELQSRARYLACDPLMPARLYAGIEVGGMLLSDDGGRNWQPANNGLTDMDVHEVHPCEKSPGLVYAACGEKAFRSFNRAAHWEEITPKSHDYGMSVIEDAKGMDQRGRRSGGGFPHPGRRIPLGDDYRGLVWRRHEHVSEPGRKWYCRGTIGRNSVRNRRLRSTRDHRRDAGYPCDKNGSVGRCLWFPGSG